MRAIHLEQCRIGPCSNEGRSEAFWKIRPGLQDVGSGVQVLGELFTIELRRCSSPSFFPVPDAVAAIGSTRFRFTRGSPSALSVACLFVPAAALGGAM